jgi:hypothetical protein
MKTARVALVTPEVVLNPSSLVAVPKPLSISIAEAG